MRSKRASITSPHGLLRRAFSPYACFSPFLGLRLRLRPLGYYEAAPFDA